MADWTKEEIEEARLAGVDLTLIQHPSVPLTEEDIRIGQEVAKMLGFQREEEVINDNI